MIIERDLVPSKKLEQGTPSQTKITGFSKEFTFFSVECPDRFLEVRPSLKQHGNTAIPTGIYDGELMDHPKYGFTFLLYNVPNFSGVFFPHIANSKEQLAGCLGIGDNLIVKESEKTKEKFNDFIKELIGRGELKIGDKIKIEVKRKTVINN